MKKLNPNKFLLSLLFLLALVPVRLMAQEEEKPSLLMDIRYFNENNRLPYITVNTKAKINKRFQPVSGIPLKIYLNEVGDSSFIGECTTDDKGVGITYLPTALADAWKASYMQTIIAVSEAAQGFDETEEMLDIIKSKMTIDTLTEDGVRSIIVTLMEEGDSGWIPVVEAEVKVGVARLGGFLPAGEEDFFFTDEEGNAVAEFSLAGLPGDEKGNLTIVARVEDHEYLGNVSAKIELPWGEPFIIRENKFERSLAGTRDKTPLWLLVMANAIILTVWGILIYLVFQIFKIKRIGKSLGDVA